MQSPCSVCWVLTTVSHLPVLMVIFSTHEWLCHVLRSNFSLRNPSSLRWGNEWREVTKDKRHCRAGQGPARRGLHFPPDRIDKRHQGLAGISLAQADPQTRPSLRVQAPSTNHNPVFAFHLKCQDRRSLTVPYLAVKIIYFHLGILLCANFFIFCFNYSYYPSSHLWHYKYIHLIYLNSVQSVFVVGLTPSGRWISKIMCSCLAIIAVVNNVYVAASYFVLKGMSDTMVFLMKQSILCRTCHLKIKGQ